MSKIVECGRSDSVKIHNPNDQGNPLSVQIPAELVYAADTMLRDMLHQGQQSPELMVKHVTNDACGTFWLAEYGGLKGISMTPWGAIRDLGRKIEMPF